MILGVPYTVVFCFAVIAVLIGGLVYVCLESAGGQPERADGFTQYDGCPAIYCTDRDHCAARGDCLEFHTDDCRDPGCPGCLT